jgi:hypothetical protein
LSDVCSGGTPLQQDGKCSKAIHNKDAHCCNFLHGAVAGCSALLVLRALFFVTVGMILLTIVSYWFLYHFTIHTHDALCESTTWELLGPWWGRCAEHVVLWLLGAGLGGCMGLCVLHGASEHWMELLGTMVYLCWIDRALASPWVGYSRQGLLGTGWTSGLWRWLQGTGDHLAGT